MIKLMIIGRRAPGLSRAAAHRHLRDVHGPMVVSPPHDAGPMPAGYVQNHVLDGVYMPSEPRLAIERDLVTELWFDNAEVMRASVSSPYYLAHLKPDEPRFVDDATVERMLVREQVVRDGPGGGFKLFLLDGQTATDQTEAASRVVENIAVPGPFGTPLAERVVEAWFDTLEDAAAALDTACGTAMVAREYSSEALRQAAAGTVRGG